LASEGMPFVSGFRVAQTDRRSELTFQTRLIGREEELNRLSMALDDATVGKGSLFLIGGESGSGKTRLVDELREYAHISSGKGATFLSGKCYEYATNIAYNPFVEAIEEYVEQVKRLSEAEREAAAAREMQLSLLPKSAPEIEDFDIAGVCEPATEVGGDYFNYLWLDEAHSKLGIVLMDVTGHGMKAAMNTFLANGMIQSEIRSGTSPEQIMAKMNQSLCAMLPKGTFVAMSFSVIDTKEKTLTHFNAGIPEPVIIRNGELVELEIPGAFPLGCWAETEYTGAGIELQSADLLVFHSDGIVEATNETGEMYVDERFGTFLATLDVQTKSAQEIMDTILTDVRTFLSDEEESDDMTVVVVKVI